MVFPSKDDCLDGINRIRKTAKDAAVEDTTSLDWQPMAAPKYRIFQTLSGNYFFRFYPDESNDIAQSHSYPHKDSLLRRIERMRAEGFSAGAERGVARGPRARRRRSSLQEVPLRREFGAGAASLCGGAAGTPASKSAHQNDRLLPASWENAPGEKPVSFSCALLPQPVAGTSLVTPKRRHSGDCVRTCCQNDPSGAKPTPEGPRIHNSTGCRRRPTPRVAP